MTAVLAVCTGLLGIAALCALWRAVVGPTMLDRVVAVDVLVIVVTMTLAVAAAASGDVTTLPVVVVLAMVGFVGSVSVARFAAKESSSQEEE